MTTTAISHSAQLLRQVMPEALLTEYLGRAFDEVLVTVCHAHPDKNDRYSFIASHLDTQYPCSEWRFGGSLGFGGKFRLSYDAAARVDCYREDETAERCATVERANTALQALRTEMLAKVSAL